MESILVKGNSEICLVCCKNIDSVDNHNDEIPRAKGQVQLFIELLQRFSNSYTLKESLFPSKNNQNQSNWLDKFGCCTLCLPMLNSFCRDYHRLKCLEMKLEFILDGLVHKMKLGEDLPSKVIKLEEMPGKLYSPPETSNGPLIYEDDSRENLQFLNIYRENIMKICNQRLSNSQPRVLLKRVRYEHYNPTECLSENKDDFTETLTSEQGTVFTEVDDEIGISTNEQHLMDLPSECTDSNSYCANSDKNYSESTREISESTSKFTPHSSILVRRKNAISKKCSKCDQIFKSEYKLKCHLIKHHKTWRCFKCDQEFPSKYWLMQHNAGTHKNSTGPAGKLQTSIHGKRSSVTCQLCNRIFAHRMSLKRHFRMRHKQHPYDEPGCGEVIVEENVDISGDEAEDSQDNFEAASTPTRQYSEIEPVIKQENDTGDLDEGNKEPEVIDSTNETLSNLNLLEIKYETPASSKQSVSTGQIIGFEYQNKSTEILECSQCPKKFRTKKKFQLHKDEAHGRFGCSKCGQQFRTKHQRNKHMLAHQTSHKWKCSICGRAFIEKYALDEHIKSGHKTGSPVSCKICDKTFLSSRRMKDHLRKVHVVNKHLCSKCGKAFKLRAQLIAHGIIHEDDDSKQYQCTECGNMFNRKFDLGRHMLNVHKK